MSIRATATRWKTRLGFSATPNPATGEVWQIEGSVFSNYPNGSYVTQAVFQQWQELQYDYNQAQGASNEDLTNLAAQEALNAAGRLQFYQQQQQQGYAPAPGSSTLVSTLTANFPSMGVLANYFYPGSQYVTFAQWQALNRLNNNLSVSPYAPPGGIQNLTADEIKTYLAAYPAQSFPFTAPSAGSVAALLPTTSFSPTTGAVIGLAPANADGLPPAGNTGTGTPTAASASAAALFSNKPLLYIAGAIALIVLLSPEHRRT
jgi:hypothetical protein